MIDPHTLEALKWVLTFLMGVLMLIGGWWGKGVTKSMADIQVRQNAMDVMLATISESLKGRDYLQDERWKNLNSTLESQSRQMDILHKDVQAIVHSQIKKDHPKS